MKTTSVAAISAGARKSSKNLGSVPPLRAAA
jgi:hypothetical protein